MSLAINTDNTDSFFTQISPEIETGLKEAEESIDFVNGYFLKTKLQTIHVSLAFIKPSSSNTARDHVQWVKKAYSQNGWILPTNYSRNDTMGRIQKAVQKALSSKELEPGSPLSKCRVSIVLRHPSFFGSTYEGKEVCNLALNPSSPDQVKA